jgi:hypothetical protein
MQKTAGDSLMSQWPITMELKETSEASDSSKKKKKKPKRM